MHCNLSGLPRHYAYKYFHQSLPQFRIINLGKNKQNQKTKKNKKNQHILDMYYSCVTMTRNILTLVFIKMFNLEFSYDFICLLFECM